MNQDRIVAFKELMNIPTDDCDSLIESSYFNAYDDLIKLSRIQSIKTKKYKIHI